MKREKEEKVKMEKKGARWWVEEDEEGK